MSKKHDDTPDSDVGRSVADPSAGKVGRNVLSKNAADALPPATVDRPQSAVAAAPAEPARVGGKLTRAGMEAAIASGQSVTLGGRVYSDAASLPTQEQIDTYHQAADEAAEKAKAPTIPAAPEPKQP